MIVSTAAAAPAIAYLRRQEEMLRRLLGGPFGQSQPSPPFELPQTHPPLNVARVESDLRIVRDLIRLLEAPQV